MNQKLRDETKLLSEEQLLDDYENVNKEIDARLKGYNEKIDTMQMNKSWNRVNMYSRQSIISEIV